MIESERSFEARIVESSDPLATWRTLKAPLKLWHYTSLHGLEGIVRTRCIHATDFRFLNDLDEIQHARKFATSQLLPSEPSKTSEGAEFLQKAIDLVSHSFGAQVAIASFTEAEDVLSQWRAYTHGTVGASMAFDLTKLSDSHFGVGTQVPCFRRCVYSKPAKEKLLLAAIQPLSGTLSIEAQFRKRIEMKEQTSAPGAKQDRGGLYRAHGRQFEPMLHHANLSTRLKLAEVIPFLKNDSFSEEEEWRICLDSTGLIGASDFPFGHRVRNDAIVPFRSINLPRKTPEEALDLKDLILGPGSTDAACSALSQFLSLNGINVDARRSTIPYRSE